MGCSEICQGFSQILQENAGIILHTKIFPLYQSSWHLTVYIQGIDNVIKRPTKQDELRILLRTKHDTYSRDTQFEMD